MSAFQGRKASLIADQYQRGERIPKPGVPVPEKHPTNEEVAKAVQQKVAAAVEMSRKYRHVAWYSLFVAAYMVVLYLQASAYKSGEVVQTLKKAFTPDNSDGRSTMTFKNEDEVLNYLGSKVLLPIWKDPICGDSKCEWPWEFPAWGRFGCRADCGVNNNVTRIAINVKADFTGHPSISPRVLMTNAKWNLCLEDDARRKRGEEDLCWFEEDESFEQVQVNAIFSMQVVDGKWYVVVKGDYAGRVNGRIFDISNGTNPININTEPAWTECKVAPSATVLPTTTAVRRLLQAYTEAHRAGPDEGRDIIASAVREIKQMPGLQHIDFSSIANRVKAAAAAAKQASVEAAGGGSDAAANLLYF